MREKTDESHLGQERNSEVDGARTWKGVLWYEVKVALNLDRPQEQKGISLNRLQATAALSPWSEAGQCLQDSRCHLGALRASCALGPHPSCTCLLSIFY